MAGECGGEDGGGGREVSDFEDMTDTKVLKITHGRVEERSSLSVENFVIQRTVTAVSELYNNNGRQYITRSPYDYYGVD
jgi:hypothetical protein